MKIIFQNITCGNCGFYHLRHRKLIKTKTQTQFNPCWYIGFLTTQPCNLIIPPTPKEKHYLPQRWSDTISSHFYTHTKQYYFCWTLQFRFITNTKLTISIVLYIVQCTLLCARVWSKMYIAIRQSLLFFARPFFLYNNYYLPFFYAYMQGPLGATKTFYSSVFVRYCRVQLDSRPSNRCQEKTLVDIFSSLHLKSLSSS